MQAHIFVSSLPSFGCDAHYICGNGPITRDIYPMESTPLFTNQLALMAALLEATRSDYFSSPDARRGDIVAGANGGNFTFRNNGAGIPFGQMVRALFPVEGDATPISNLYPIESLIGADLFELHSFVEKEHRRSLRKGQAYPLQRRA